MDSTWWFLAKYHNVFSLEPTELGCTQSTKHVIKVTDDSPFKEWFRQIPPSLVEKVHNHLWEILDAGTIRPNQSAWCKVVVLVRKKDGGLYFWIDFYRLNAHIKKDSYPLPGIQEALDSLVGAGHFSCLDLKLGFWQKKNGGDIETVYCLYGRQFGVFWVQPHALQAMQHASWCKIVSAN